jgi:hypothetical protein
MYRIELKTMHFSNGKRHQFPMEIAEALEFEESIVIRLDAALFSAGTNIFGFDYSGNLLWNIPAPRSFEPRNPYVSLLRKGGYLEVLNWDGHVLTLHPKHGHIIGEGQFDGGHSSYSPPPPRQWM